VKILFSGNQAKAYYESVYVFVCKLSYGDHYRSNELHFFVPAIPTVGVH